MRTLCLAAGAAAGLALLTAASQASAETPATAPATFKLDAHPAAVSDADLADMSGGAETVPPSIAAIFSSQTFDTTNTNNVVAAGNNVSSGDVNLGQNAFQGFAGVGNFVVNTGHNNNVIGALSIAINMAPSTGTQ